MINRMKSYLCVYRRAIEIIGTLAFLVIIGGIAGYAIGKSEAKKAITEIQVAHLQEVDRLQTIHSFTIDLMADRLWDLINKSIEAAQEISDAAKEAKQASSTASQASTTARAASKNAAKSAIRIRELPTETELKPKSEAQIDPDKQFPELIEH